MTRTSPPGRARARRPPATPRLEFLEDRLAPATLTVTTTKDELTPNDGGVSLRETITAINAGNNLGDPDVVNTGAAFGVNDTIKFNLPGTGPFLLPISGILPFPTGLPAVTKPVVIDGASQPGYAGAPVVELVNALFTPNAGLTLQSPGITVQGLAIDGFSGCGILVEPPPA
jgi:hypothetical protein